MQPTSPWVGVVLIIVGVISAVVFTHFKIPEAGIPLAIITVAITILTGRQHATAIKNSIRPGPMKEGDEDK